MRKLIFVVLIVFGSGVYANYSLFLVGIDNQLEKKMDQSVQLQAFSSYGAYLEMDSIYLGIELLPQSGANTSGTSAYTISKTRTMGFLEILYFGSALSYVKPYINVGLGGYQDVVQTRFVSSASEDTSRIYASGLGGIGVSINTQNMLFASAEARVIFAENLDPQPHLAYSIRLGMCF